MIDSTNFFVLEDFDSHINKTYIFNFPIEEVFKAFTDRELIVQIFPYNIHRVILRSAVDDDILDIDALLRKDARNRGSNRRLAIVAGGYK